MPAAKICEFEFCCVGLLPKDFSLIFSTVTLRCVLMHVVYVVVYLDLASGSERIVEETSNTARGMGRDARRMSVHSASRVE